MQEENVDQNSGDAPKALPSGLVIKTGHHCDRGLRPTMEDAVIMSASIAVDKSDIVKAPCHFYCVLDGHGGKKCAKWCAENLETYVSKNLRTESEVGEALVTAYQEADEEWIENETDASGTTACGLLIDESQMKYCVANTGDSRCIMASGGTARALSRDHKPTRDDEKARIEAAGGHVLFGRTMGMLAVSRAIGDVDFKSGDTQHLVIPDPEVHQGVFTEDDDFFVIACDGLYDVASNDEIVQHVYELLGKGNTSCEAISASLVDFALKERYSRDNVSVVVITLKDYANMKDVNRMSL